MSAKPLIKRLESLFKRFLKSLLLISLPRRKAEAPKAGQVRKLLVFRLDQRVGNGLLLLPLLNALRESRHRPEAHLLIHAPVAKLFESSVDFPAGRIWSYDQPKLIKKPWQYITLLRQLRREYFDVVIACNNPDNFSLSQAIFGRMIRPGYLVGFDARDSAAFYDIAVSSGTDRHYADAMVDLWRVIEPSVKTRFAALKMPDQLMIEAVKNYPQYATGGVLIWLGATGQKVLPGEIWELIYQTITANCKTAVHIAAGPADERHLQKYPAWLRDKTIVWQTPLTQSAALLTRFSVFVSADTGPMHLAAALGCATFTIFLNPNIIQYGYQEADHAVAMRWTGGVGEEKVVENNLKRFLAANQ